MIKENTKMVNVPSFTANTTDPRIFVTEQIQPSANPCFFYVPYCLGHINYCDLDSPERNVISSKFSGCLMVIWQEAEGYPIRIGHVDTAAGSSRKTDWDTAKANFRFAYEFKPSDYIPTIPKGMCKKDCYGLYAINQATKSIAAFSITTADSKEVQDYVIRKKLVFTKPLP